MPSRSQRPRLPETSESQRKAKLAWNQGLTGSSRPADTRPAFEACTADGCGTPVVGRRPPAHGLVQVSGSAAGAAVHGSAAAVGRAAIARARAEIRAIPMRPDGDR